MNDDTDRILRYIISYHKLPNLDEIFKNKKEKLKETFSTKIDLVVPYVDNTDDY